MIYAQMLCYFVLQLVAHVFSSIPNWLVVLDEYNDMNQFNLSFSVRSSTPPGYKGFCPVSPREQVDLKVFLHYSTSHNMPEQEEDLNWSSLNHPR